MVILAEIPDRVKKEETFVVDIMKAALDTGNKHRCFSDSKKGNEKQRKEQLKEVITKFHERQSADKAVECKDLKMDEDPASKKRKRQCFSSTLDWIRNLAKKPFDLDTEPLPETKWRYCDSDLPWKQVLLIRECLMMKVDASQPYVSQKKQRMHPSMYEDSQCNNDRVRCSRRILAAKDSFHKGQDHSPKSSPSGSFDDESSEEKQLDDALFSNHRRKRPRIGSLFQASLPESCAGEYSSDPKWLGTKVWPLEKTDTKRSIIEIEPIGVGRPLHCGCEFPGDPHCVSFHITEKRMKKMLELRSAFYSWKLDYMGTNVALSWTKEDQKKFQDIVETNRLSSDKYFWDELFKCFPGKGREALVSYYFNVYLLRRRSEQNRSETSDIYSDDEESELGPIGNRFGQSTAGSIFCSPKKTTANSGSR